MPSSDLNCVNKSNFRIVNEDNQKKKKKWVWVNKKKVLGASEITYLHSNIV